MSGRQTVRDADTGLQTCVHVGDLKELAERLRASDDSCMYFGCWDGPECDGCQAYESPYDCSGAMAHDAADRIDSAITRGVFSAGDNDDPASYAAKAVAWVASHGGLKALRDELPVLAYRASLVGDVYGALDIDPGEPHAAVLLSREVKRIREDHDALLWMDEHGGLGQVKMDCAMGDGFADLADRVAAKLGVDVEGLDAQDSEPVIMDAIDRRLVPDGMEWLLEVWPRWSNGEYCKFGDWWMSEKYGERKPQQLRKLAIYSPEQLREWGQDDGDHFGYEWDYMRPSDTTYRPDKVEPPAPKVLDADGEEIEVGDDLYSVEGMLKFHVSAIDTKNARIATEAMFALDKWADPTMYTHRAPVLAADGKPLREGETVYTLKDSRPYKVAWLDGNRVHINAGGSATDVWRMPDQLTHERPDSLDRLADELGAMAAAWRMEKDCLDAQKAAARCVGEETLGKALDSIVRRARALAERGL